jgi:aminoglycoside phosphotransferase family enzyme
MYNIKLELRTREGLVESVYDCIRSNTPLSSIHIPHSDVFFVREALEARFKCELSLSQVEEYMKEAGWTDGDN